MDRHRCFGLTMAVLAVAACTGPGPEPAPSEPLFFVREPPPRWDLVPPRFEPPGEVAEVSLTRAPCPGCPGETIRLGTDAVIRISTGSHAPREGRIPPIVVDMLVLYALDSSWLAAAKHHGTGESVVITTVEVGGQRTEIVDAGDALAPVRGLEWMIDAAAQLADWDPPPPDDRSEMLRRDLCAATIAELGRGLSTTALHLSPLGRWPAWSYAPQQLCVDTSVRVAGPASAPRFTDLREVTLSRRHCYEGGCPDYEARLRADGRVYFRGNMHVNRRGVSLGRVPPVVVEMLATYAVDTGFPDTKPQHGGHVRHSSRKHTSLALAGRRTWTMTAGSDEVPPAIEGFERMIDAALTMTTWDPAPPGVTPPAGGARELCAPVFADVRARCEESLAGVGPSIACERAFHGISSLPAVSDGLVAHCAYLGGVLPDPPPRAQPPKRKLGPGCRRLFKTVRALCLDVLTPGNSKGPELGCQRWLPDLAEIVGEPDPARSCKSLAEEIAEELAADRRREAARRDEQTGGRRSGR